MEMKRIYGIAVIVFFAVYGLVLAVDMAISMAFKDGRMKFHIMKLFVYWAAFYVCMRGWEALA